MRRLPFAAALLLGAGTVATVPAGAAPAPAGQNLILAGASCGLESQGPPRNGAQSGYIQAGPVTATSPEGGEILVTLTCSLRVGTSRSSYEVVREQSPTGHPAVLPPTPVNFAIPAGADLFVCFEISVYQPPNAPTVVPYDYDPVEPGPQCRRPQKQQGEISEVHVAPSDPFAIWCVQVRDPNLPQGSHTQCNPLGRPLLAVAGTAA